MVMLPTPPRVEGDGECYVCGVHNERGLHMTFTLTPDGELVSRVAFGPHHDGGDGTVHGGFLLMVLDEMAVELLLHQGIANVSTEFRLSRGAPLAPGSVVECRARRMRAKGPLVEVSVEARRVDDPRALVAHGSIVCVRTTAGALRRRTFAEQPQTEGT